MFKLNLFSVKENCLFVLFQKKYRADQSLGKFCSTQLGGGCVGERKEVVSAEQLALSKNILHFKLSWEGGIVLYIHFFPLENDI